MGGVVEGSAEGDDGDVADEECCKGREVGDPAALPAGANEAMGLGATIMAEPWAMADAVSKGALDSAADAVGVGVAADDDDDDDDNDGGGDGGVDADSEPRTIADAAGVRAETDANSVADSRDGSAIGAGVKAVTGQPGETTNTCLA
jgi:hypothetical protein